MPLSVIQTSLATGEISPALWGHTDLAKVRASATTMRNMYVNVDGGADSRAGTAFVCRSKQTPINSDPPPRLIAFTFSVSQTYELEFGDRYLRFIYRGGAVVEAAQAITAASQGNPCQIGAIANGFNNGDWVAIAGIVGMTELNGNTYIVANAAVDTFTLQDLDGNNIDSTIYGVYVSGGTAARIYEIVTPYVGADVALLKFTQSADVLSLTHPNYAPHDLSRLGATNWVLAPTSFASSIGAPSSATATRTVGPSGTLLPCAYAYVVTAIDPKTGQESVASPIAHVTNSVNMSITAASIMVSWDPVIGAQNYNIYKSPSAYNTLPGNPGNAAPVPAGSPFGFMASSFGNEFIDTNITPDFVITPPQHRNPFVPGQIVSVTMGASSGDWTIATAAITSATGAGFVGQCVIVIGEIHSVIVLDSGGNYQNGDTITFAGDGTSADGTLVIGPQTGTYPGVVAYFQQRRVYANSLNLPDTFWASQPGAFTNFDTSIPVTDSDAITSTISSEQVNGIQWMKTMPLGLVMFTGSGVLQVGAANSQAGSPSAITPANQLSVPQNSIGSSSLVEPIKINWDILYVEEHGAAVRDLTYQFFFNNYIGTDISWQSSHLLDGHEIIQWAWCIAPYRLAWTVLDDGSLLSLAFLKEQEVNGWSRHDTQGDVRAVSAIREHPVDALYLVAQRVIGDGSNSTRYFIERMDNRIWAGVEDIWAVDCAIALPQVEPAADIGFSANSGLGVTASSNLPVFQPGDVGNIIRFGGGIFWVTSITGATAVVGNWIYPCQKTVPGGVAGDWTMAPQVTVISGLGHLAGKTVTGLADGIPITPRVVSAAGTITLDRAASKVVVGLGFTAQLQSIHLDTGHPTIQGKRKAISAATVRVKESSFLQIGADQQDASALTPRPPFVTWTLPPAIISADARATYLTASGGVVQPLFTGDVRGLIKAEWKKTGQVAVQQTLPLALSVTALIPEVLPGDLNEIELSQRRAPAQQRAAA